MQISNTETIQGFFVREIGAEKRVGRSCSLWVMDGCVLKGPEKCVWRQVWEGSNRNPQTDQNLCYIHLILLQQCSLNIVILSSNGLIYFLCLYNIVIIILMVGWHIPRFGRWLLPWPRWCLRGAAKW